MAPLAGPVLPEEAAPAAAGAAGGRRDLPEGYPGEIMLVLGADLYLVPFAVLKAPTAQVIQQANPTSYFYFKCCFVVALGGGADKIFDSVL